MIQEPVPKQVTLLHTPERYLVSRAHNQYLSGGESVRNAPSLLWGKKNLYSLPPLCVMLHLQSFSGNRTWWAIDMPITIYSRMRITGWWHYLKDIGKLARNEVAPWSLLQKHRQQGVVLFKRNPDQCDENTFLHFWALSTRAGHRKTMSHKHPSTTQEIMSHSNRSRVIQLMV